MCELFMQPLHTIYTDIYTLNKIGFSGEYIDSMTALERNMFKLYRELETTTEEDNGNEETLKGMGISPDMLL